MLTMGVEEEYLLLDTATGLPTAKCPRVRAVASALPSVGDGEVTPELLQAQIEIATPVCTTLREVDTELRRLRAAVRQAATAVGCSVAATGAAPARGPAVTPVSDCARYARMRAHVGVLVDEQLITGMHVHVGVPDRDAAVAAVTWLRPWLPVLAAMGANSPLWDGQDTGYASWRTLLFGRWPVSGPPPAFSCTADYERRVQDLLHAGAIADRGQLYWHARPSERYPTVEVRILDVQPGPCDAVLMAALVRGLVARSLTDTRRGLTPPSESSELLATNTWWAARHGLEATLCDPRDGRQREAGAVVAGLLERAEPALHASGDLEAVRDGVDRLLRLGSPAQRQRAAYREGGVTGVLELITRDG